MQLVAMRREQCFVLSVVCVCFAVSGCHSVCVCKYGSDVLFVY